MSERRLRIGLFDSGLGGLSVLRHAVSHLRADYVYIADSLHAPWGQADHDWVCDRSLALSRFLLEQGMDALVIACNTATALAADVIRAELPIPVVAMEPAIKPAAGLSRNGKIAVLATRATLQSTRYRELRTDHAAGLEVHEMAPHHWITALEQGRQDDPDFLQRLHADLAPMRWAGVDTWVLACTHFPLLLPQLRKVLGGQARLIDPAPAVTAQLGRVLDRQPLQQLPGGSLRLLTSGDPAVLRMRLSILGLRGSVKVLEMDGPADAGCEDTVAADVVDRATRGSARNAG